MATIGPAGARQSSLRDNNLRLVLQRIVAAHEPPSRAQVAHSTSMTRSTVSRLVDDLVHAGFVNELAPQVGSGPGRPATPLVPSRGKIVALGLQVNTEFIAAVAVDLAGQVLATRRQNGQFVGSNPLAVLGDLGDLARQILGKLPRSTRVVGAGLALPGIVVAGTGRLMRAPNLGWSQVEAGPLLLPMPAKGMSGQPVHLGVRMGNEADFAALTVAQNRPGRSGDLADFVYLAGEVGVGGALVTDGTLAAGRSGLAGEIGHVCVDPNGPACRCGSTGCLEQYVGGDALRREAEAISPAPATAGSTPGSTPGSTAWTPREAVAALVASAKSGDERAEAVLQRASWALSVALGGVVNVVDIPTIVLGGHLGALGAYIKDDLTARLATRVLGSAWSPPRIVIARGVADSDVAGAHGAALAELQTLIANPARWVKSTAD